MMNRFIFPFLLMFSGCSTFKQEAVDCPNLTSPKSAAEITAKSENNIPVYVGIRGITTYCLKGLQNIEMDVSVNIRAIRTDITIDDYVPLKLSIVSVDKDYNEYDRDELSYSQFLLLGSKTVDRKTELNLDVPKDGEVFLGIK
ncbi:MAG: hypothetical protein P8J21_01135 [Alphaproteobacteria bacterium]|nr:hypothetical protein [Alphaproteobacteria bacterium]